MIRLVNVIARVKIEMYHKQNEIRYKYELENDCNSMNFSSTKLVIKELQLVDINYTKICSIGKI